MYNPADEYRRMGVESSSASCPWALKAINQDYGVCSSYPAYLVMPKSMSDDSIRSVAKHRKRGRLPSMSWCASSYASLFRCSQPTEGMLGKESQEDEQLLKLIRASTPGGRDRKLLTLDLRTQKAAYANKVGGGGFENYEHCRLVFGGIDNVHGVRGGWQKMWKAVSGLSSSEVGSWLKDIANSGWYDIMGAVLSCVCTVITEIHDHKCSALIHCSDGWDRTAQVSSLVMLCMDPHYRSLHGFLILISKEFCSYGHRFRTRLGNGEQPTSEYSPIFIQWLECVYQLTVQFPQAFEFSSDLLLFIGKEVFTNRYGTFLVDSEMERQSVAKGTLSLWPAILNPGGSSGPAAEHLNPEYKPSIGLGRVLRPSPSQINFKIWEGYWFRYIKHPRDL